MQTDSVDALVAPKLKQYAEWRGRWPLWTGHQAAWAGESWPDRIHWSAQRLLVEVGLQLSRNLPGFRVTNIDTDKLHYVAFRTGPGSPGPFFLPLPSLLRLHALSIGAQFSTAVPAKLDEIQVPALSIGGMFESDISAFAGRTERALKSVGAGQTDTLAGRFARHHMERGAGLQPKESEARLAVELVRQVGLAVPHKRKTRNTISPAVLDQLRSEFREIVRAVHSWEIHDEEMIQLGNLLVDDQQIALKKETWMQTWLWLLGSGRERRLEHGRRLAQHSWVRLEALRVVFPFLTRSELSAITKEGKPDLEAADDLLIGRLPATITPQTLGSIISRLRHARLCV